MRKLTENEKTDKRTYNLTEKYGVTCTTNGTINNTIYYNVENIYIACICMSTGIIISVSIYIIMEASS